MSDNRPDPIPERQHKQAVLRDLRTVVREMLGSLKGRDALVLRLRYGLDGLREHEYSEIGDRLGITAMGAQNAVERAAFRSRRLLSIRGFEWRNGRLCERSATTSRRRRRGTSDLTGS